MSTASLKAIADLKAETLAHLKSARAVADFADSKGRDLTPTEKKEAYEHLDAAKKSKATMDLLTNRDRDAADFSGQLKNISDSIGLDDSSYGNGGGFGGDGGRLYTPAGSKNNDGGRKWGAAVVQANSDNFRYKGITEAGAVLVGVPAPSIVEMGRPVPTMRSLIPAENTAGGRFAYHRQVLRTNRAAPVAAGNRKPTSDYGSVLVEDRARVIAHISQSQSRMDFEDAPTLQGWIADEMYFGLEMSLENELINGDGTGEHLTGLAFTSGIQTQAYTSSLITTTRSAVTKLETLGFNGSGWVLSPQDWQDIELSANSTGSLLLTEAGSRAPIDSSARRLWGRPVIASPSCPVGVGYFADFSSTKLYVRSEARLDWSEHLYRADQFGAEEGGTLFEANEIVFRVEGRFGFAVTRPNAVVKIDLTA